MARDPNPAQNSSLTVGSANSWGYSQWPNQGFWTQAPPVSNEHYANHVEVERGEHDATLRFYRLRGKSKSLVREITVPLALLDSLSVK